MPKWPEPVHGCLVQVSIAGEVVRARKAGRAELRELVLHVLVLLLRWRRLAEALRGRRSVKRVRRVGAGHGLGRARGPAAPDAALRPRYSLEPQHAPSEGELRALGSKERFETGTVYFGLGRLVPASPEGACARDLPQRATVMAQMAPLHRVSSTLQPPPGPGRPIVYT